MDFPTTRTFSVLPMLLFPPKTTKIKIECHKDCFSVFNRKLLSMLRHFYGTVKSLCPLAFRISPTISVLPLYLRPARCLPSFFRTPPRLLRRGFTGAGRLGRLHCPRFPAPEDDPPLFLQVSFRPATFHVTSCFHLSSCCSGILENRSLVIQLKWLECYQRAALQRHGRH